MKQKIAVIDYKMGNIFSVIKNLNKLNCTCEVISQSQDLSNFDKIVFPGVGHFENAMNNLHSLKLVNVLNEAVLIKKKPILGICLGMQLMCTSSEEAITGKAYGLNWINAEVIKFEVKDTLKYKIPHIGWNAVSIKKDSLLMQDIADRAEFYFVHSFHCKTNENLDILNTTHYEHEFVSAIQKENIFGVQYHPEKSHETGFKLLSNFISI